MNLRRWILMVGVLAFSTQTLRCLADDMFSNATLGEMPKGWIAAKTGTGEGSVWKVQEDATAPNGNRVLVQTSGLGPNTLFNLAISDAANLIDVNMELSLKPLSGKIDQGGGPVWRYRNSNNYYVARWNPLEGDFRLFKVIDGKRTQLGTTVSLDSKLGEWHTISVSHLGDHIKVSFDQKTVFNVDDASIQTTGKFGMWTKADAVTAFTSPLIRTNTASDSPKSVLVVNTQDASVSNVDLTTMKEISRNPVGGRPYGITVSKDGKRVAVGVEDEECVKFFSLPDFTLLGKTPIGKMFNDHIVLTQDGKSVMVANFYSDDVVLIDIDSMKETGRIAGCSAPHVVKFGPLQNRAFVTCKKVTGIAIIDPVKQELIKFHQLNVNPRSLTFSPDESKAYFGSFWVNGFFELDMESGKVTRLFSFDPPAENALNQEVTYHGVEAVGDNIVLAANEGRSFVDSVDVSTGKLLDRLTAVEKPCCIERIPGSAGEPTRVLVSALGDGTLHFVEIGAKGKMKDLGHATVGKAPKRVAFVYAQRQ